MLRTVEQGAALFRRDRDLFVPTRYTEGPWDPGAQFGGAPAALIATLIDETPSLVAMQVARLTIDLLRPVPVEPLAVNVRVVREGKKIQVLEASMLSGETEVVRCSALRIRCADLGGVQLPEGLLDNALPAAARPVDEDPFPIPDPHGGRL